MYTWKSLSNPDLRGLHFDPVGQIIEFIQDCRNNGADKFGAICEMVEHLNYMPAEADIIVNEFWDKTA